MRKFANIRKGNRESGYGLVFAAFGLIVLLGAAGLSVDIGYLRYQRRLLQSATDSAALAGAAELGAGGSAAQAIIAAKNDSQLNGFQDGSGNIVVNATQIAVNGNTNTMQVQVTNIYPTFFMRIFGAASRNVTVSTVATAQYLGGRGCIYALTGGAGINVTGTVNVPNCNVISNQNITGGGSITAASIGAHGRSSVAATPPVITGTLQASDPLCLPSRASARAVDAHGKLHSDEQRRRAVNFEPREILRESRSPARARWQIQAWNSPSNSNIVFNPGTYVITRLVAKLCVI